MDVVRIDHPDYEKPLLLGTIAQELTTEQIWSGYKHRSPVETNFFVAQDLILTDFVVCENLHCWLIENLRENGDFSR